MLVLCPSSLILWGVGAAKGIKWIGLVIGMGMISCSTGIGSSLSLGFALGSYRDLSGEVMMAVIIVRVRHSFSFAVALLTCIVLQNSLSFAIVGPVSVFINFIMWLKLEGCRGMGSHHG